MKVGFIGLGMMGSGMARNLIKAGHALVVFNRTRSRAQELAQLGATVAATLGEAAGSGFAWSRGNGRAQLGEILGTRPRAVKDD